MVTRSLEHGWVVAVVVAVIVVVGVVGYRTRRGPAASTSVRWVANAAYLTQLASFRSRLQLYRVGLATAAVVALVGGVAAGVVIARPVEKQVVNSELATRDIVLCLDVSISMVEYDAEIIDQFLDLLETFDGERVALSVWNNGSRTVFPLTDDYTLVREELEIAREALDVDIDTITVSSEAGQRLLRFLAGAQLSGTSNASLIGDGLVTCGQAFDEAEVDRSRTILLASDNQVSGTPIYRLPEAAAYVAERDIGIIGILSGDPSTGTGGERKEFEDVIDTHDGLFFEASDPSAVDAIVERIQSEQAVELDATPEVVVTDRPAGAVTALVACGALLVLALWRLRT